MTNQYYEHDSYPRNGAPGSAAALRAELELIEDACDKLPALAGQGKKLIAVKSDASGLEPVTSIDGSVLTSLRVSSNGGIGYGGAVNTGGTVTQLTSKSTGVTLNFVCGHITMHNAALAAGAKVSFVVTNSNLNALGGVLPWIVGNGTANAYRVDVTQCGSGTFTLTVENITAGSLSEAPIIGYAVFKIVTT